MLGPALAQNDALPDARPGRGRNDIALAWLVEPTERYRHGVLGDSIEAGALKVRLRDGRELSHALPEDSVFEDLQPRVVDLDADGQDEVLVVRSRQSAGASLMALGMRAGKLVPLAETPAIGTAHRWLNPLGAADVDGDGRLDVLLVQTPHIGGTLIVYGYENQRFTEKARVPGFSNHVIGSRALALHAFRDVDGDGTLDVILPSADRRALRVMSFANGKVRELNRIVLPAPAVGDFRLEDGALSVPLADGTRHRVRL